MFAYDTVVTGDNIYKNSEKIDQCQLDDPDEYEPRFIKKKRGER